MKRHTKIVYLNHLFNSGKYETRNKWVRLPHLHIDAVAELVKSKLVLSKTETSRHALVLGDDESFTVPMSYTYTLVKLTVLGRRELDVYVKNQSSPSR